MFDPDEPPLGYLLHRLSNALRVEVTSTALDPLGLAFPQYICMRILSRWPGRSNAELARDVMVSPQAMNMVVRGLQDRGLVTRPDSVSSGRSRPAELTREGAALLKQSVELVKLAEDRTLAPLTEDDQRDLRRILAEFG
jgi:DNA-binding MarR family transcriptional regulator